MKKINLKNKKQGFTIIEILVVVFIIAILSSLAVISFDFVRKNNRDAKRLADISQLKLALENYRLFEGGYPASITPGNSLVGSTTGNIYLNPVPVNDSYQDISCSQNAYYYTLASSTDYYTILFCLEKNIDKYTAGEKCFVSSNGEILSAPCP